MAESPKIASEKKKFVNPRAEEVNHRYYIKYFRDTLAEVKSSVDHMLLLGKTPFFHFLEMPEIHCEGQLVEKIFWCFELDDRFILGGVTCKFTKEEVALITGLPFYGKALDLQSKKISDIRLLQKHFPDKHLHRKDVRVKLIQLYPSNEEEDKQDFVRILIILMCATFLLPNKGYECPNNLMRYLEDLDATWEFSWASAVHQMIIEDLRLFAERIRRRDAGEGVSLGYIGGCTAALMVWFYEHTRLQNSLAYGKVPRFFRWGRTNNKSPLVRCSEQFHLLTADQVDPELNIGQQEEHLFRSHEETLVLEKLKMRAIQRRIKEVIIEGKGKRKLVEVEEESMGKKRREEEKKGKGGREEEVGGRKKKQEAKIGEEVLIKEPRK
ncbi:hypothetical protein QJS04_geneDACA014414 [Acorus gramineus]|uniref:Aminotransferase-like plant mobile domain-containing protein n=1 Tax=Acorus gramineus TaxID=55184 RepID=A0AAV9BPF8_ACOGR|nr:hypothetical protein QJS04_geneDACA014414 [Acorus gramineus]